MAALPFKLKMNAKTLGIGAGALVGLFLVYKLAFHKSKKAAEDTSTSGDAAALAQIQAQLNQQGQTLAAATAAPAAPAYGTPGYGLPYTPAYAAPTYGTPGYVAPYAAPGTTQASGPPATPPVGGYQWIWNGAAWTQTPAATPVGMHWQQLGSTFQLAPNASSVAYIDRRPASPASIIPTTVLTPPN
jgi:hypothetical protein